MQDCSGSGGCIGLGVRKEIGTFDCSGYGSWLIHFFLTDAYDIVICVGDWQLLSMCCLSRSYACILRFIMVMVWECNFNSYGIW